MINEDNTVHVNLEAEAKTGHLALVTLFTFTLFSSSKLNASVFDM